MNDITTSIDRAVEELHNDGLVLHPTGGLWGLGADPFSLEALDRLRMAKWLKPGPRPFVLLVEPDWISSITDSERLPGPNISRLIPLIERYWPGGLTLILPAGLDTPADVCLIGPNGPTVAVRHDDHPVAKELCRRFGQPMISTSANRTGQPSAATLDQVPDQIREHALVLDAAPPPGGTGSTVLDLTVFPPVVHREGRVSKAELLSFFD